MAQKSDTAKHSRLKPMITIVAFVATLVLLFMGIVLVSNWVQFRPYRTLANELNSTLGGGYKIKYNWNCSIDTPNCPSVRMLKDADFRDNDEAKALLGTYKAKLNSANFTSVSYGACEADKYFVVYCTLDAKKDHKVVTINAKQDFIGVDIQP